MTAQVVLNGLVTGMVVALPAVALTLIYGILKFPNFAIGAMLTVGAYLALALNVYLSLPVLYAAAIGAAVFSVVAVGIDQAVFRPLRERSAITLLAASILGGLGNPVGAVLGALTVGVVEETSTLLIPPNYRQVISFCAIALLLLLRPQGLLGAQRIKK